ncbi:ABC transporter ATP-binding protein [Corynebacterium sp.]|uniref:ABC transporter ATP-binding protein n=1 Tax=Corynebacterium sp. TaxID=1720 RepID=UPI0026DC1BF8|nr:ABC transporter ATP-binding protein [Corynebacterium sp.]MDO4611177.1 ABC transporter ATP-binding protein [Corynebacterium sp.]
MNTEAAPAPAADPGAAAPDAALPGAPAAAIAVRGAVKRFGDVVAVDRVDLAIAPGEVVALLGHNGAGKTTLLDMVLGFTNPDEGSVSVLGGSPAAAARSGRVGAMLQSGALLDDLTVGRTLTTVAGLHRDHLPVDEVLRRTGLADVARRRVGKCSGGQRQRLRFALALLMDPDLLLLDEPTAGMDAAARREFWEYMKAEARRGRTVVFATHYLQEADEFADRLVLMRRGRVTVDGAVAELVSAEERTLTGRWLAGAAPADAAAAAGVAVADVATHDDGRVALTCRDTDALALALLRDGAIADVEITRRSVEDLFFEYAVDDGGEPGAARDDRKENRR